MSNSRKIVSRLSELKGSAYERLMASKARKDLDRRTIRQTGDSSVKLKPNISKYPRQNIQELIHKGKYDVAISKCLSDLGKDPEYASANQTLAHIYQMQGNYESAIKYYKRALVKHTLKGEILNHIGTCYRALDRHDEAKVYHKEAFTLNPRDKYAYHGLLESLINSHDEEDAFMLIQKHHHVIEPDRDIYRTYAAFWLILGDLQSSLQNYINGSPDMDKDRLYDSYVKFCWNKIIKLCGSDITRMIGAGQSFKGNGLKNLAKKFFDFASNNEDGHTTPIKKAAAFVLAGEFGRATSYFIRHHLKK